MDLHVFDGSCPDGGYERAPSHDLVPEMSKIRQCRFELSIVIVLLASIVLTGCSYPRQTWYRPGPVVQTNQEGESVTVDIRIYQLANPKRFLQADFDQLWINPGEQLAGDLLSDPFNMTIRPATGVADTDDVKPRQVGLNQWHKQAEFLGIQLLNPEAPEKGARRLVIPGGDVDDRVIVVERGALSLEKR